MEQKKCKNKNCPKLLPEGYKHKYCENCRNERVKQFKKAGKVTLNLLSFVSVTAVAVVTKGRINPNKK